MILDELAQHLESAGIGTIGTTLFKGSLPMDTPTVTTPDAIMALIETPGLPPVRTHDQPPSRYSQPVIQVLTRGVPYGYATARHKAQEAWDVLDGIRNQTLAPAFYLWIDTREDPWWLRTDELHRPLFVFQIRCARSL